MEQIVKELHDIIEKYSHAIAAIPEAEFFWVKTNGYQHATAENVLALWELVNLQIIAVLRTMPAAHYSRTCNTGRQSDELHSLQWLAADYVKHLKHHINQIIPGSFDSKYP